MADQSDVEAALVGLASAVLYPAGPDAASLPGAVCRVYRGWPNAAALDGDLASGVVNITVFSDPADQRLTTRWLDEEMVAASAATLRVANDSDGVTFTGAADAGQLAGVLADDIAVVHRTRAGDTPGRVAAILAAALRDSRTTLLSGATIAVPGTTRLVGRVAVDRAVTRETRRQRMGFVVTCWCPDPGTRDLVAAALDAALSASRFIALSDGTMGRLTARGSASRDRMEDAALYRRDLRYEIEFATTQTSTLPSMLFGEFEMIGGAAGAVATTLS